MYHHERFSVGSRGGKRRCRAPKREMCAKDDKPTEEEVWIVLLSWFNPTQKGWEKNEEGAQQSFWRLESATQVKENQSVPLFLNQQRLTGEVSNFPVCLN